MQYDAAQQRKKLGGFVQARTNAARVVADD
jgi:hypothetical protein